MAKKINKKETEYTISVTIKADSILFENMYDFQEEGNMYDFQEEGNIEHRANVIKFLATKLNDEVKEVKDLSKRIKKLTE